MGLMDIFFRPKEPDQPKVVPPEFSRIFGDRPGDVHEAAKWETDLNSFSHLGLPPYIDMWREQGKTLEASEAVFLAHGLGVPEYFAWKDHGYGRFRWRVAFPDGPLVGWDASAFTAVLSPANITQKYHIDLMKAGLRPPVRHPWIQDSLYAKYGVVWE